MNRPFIFCHMETSIDGKIMGKYLWIPETNTESDPFYSIVFGDNAKYKFEALISGRTTVEDNYTFYESPDVDTSITEVPAGDYIAPQAELGGYHVVLDGSGRIAWKDNTSNEGGKSLHVVEVLTNRASAAYKAWLRDKGISYLICGDTQIDLHVLMEKLVNVLSVKTAMLGGGAVINWSFMQEGLVDELSQVIAPAADGNPNTQPLFLAKEGITTDQPITFDLLEVEKLEDNFIWLRYRVGTKSTYDFDNDPDYKAVQDMIRANQGK